MFEYLMPLLVMPNYENTLLDQNLSGSVQRQIEYGDFAACRGACRNPVTTRSTFISTTSTARSRAWTGLKRGLRKIWSSPPMLGAGIDGGAGSGMSESTAPRRARA